MHVQKTDFREAGDLSSLSAPIALLDLLLSDGAICCVLTPFGPALLVGHDLSRAVRLITLIARTGFALTLRVARVGLTGFTLPQSI